MSAPNPSRLRTGEILVAAGTISPAQLELALKEQRARQLEGAPLPLAEILVRNRFCSRADAERAVSRTVSGEVQGLFELLLPLEVCRRYGVYPERIEEGTLVVRASRPLSDQARGALLAAARLSAQQLRVVAASQTYVTRELSRHADERIELAECLEALRVQEPTGELIGRTLDALMRTALTLHASDIHLDLRGDLDSWISWRVDGVLQRSHVVARRVLGPLVMRIKTEAGMDASETRREQDGRIQYQRGGRSLTFRVSAMPVEGGEALAVRMLDADTELDLPALFPNQPELLDELAGFLTLRVKRGGLVILSGQTGSGKTATLNAMGRLLPRERCNLLTIEDPVELSLPFARQCQINNLLEQNMRDLARTLVRQDPDALIIGEARDADSACVALKMAESGHLVFVTVHAESPLQALQRFVSMVGERESREWATFVIAQFLRLSINQSLYPRLCPHCAVPVVGGHAVHAAGCPHCVSGRRNRVLVHETLWMHAEVPLATRHALQAALLSGAMAELEAVMSQAGVRHMRRAEVAQRLIEHGALAVSDLDEFSMMKRAQHD